LHQPPLRRWYGQLSCYPSNRFLRIEADRLCEIEKFDQVHAALTAFYQRDE
jgi:hypothetical protein